MSYRKYATRALKLLHKSLPELRMGHDLLFVPPVEHILRCFILETSLNIKGTAYFWRVVMPLYRPPSFLVVNYGQRLLGGERVSLLEEELDCTIHRLAQTVRGGELERLKAIETPKDFLQQVDWSALPSTPNYQIDLALTYYMSGDAAACQDILDRLAGGQPRPRWAKETILAQELAHELRANPSALATRIAAWEQAAVSRLHLETAAQGKAHGARRGASKRRENRSQNGE
jgi:hypothetical protein